MDWLLETGDVVLRHRVGVRLIALAGFGHVRIDGLGMKEPAAGEALVGDPQVLATLAWLPRRLIWDRVSEGGRRHEGGDHQGEGFDGDGSTHLVLALSGRPNGSAVVGFLPPTQGIPARDKKGSIGCRESLAGI